MDIQRYEDRPTIKYKQLKQGDVFTWGSQQHLCMMCYDHNGVTRAPINLTRACVDQPLIDCIEKHGDVDVLLIHGKFIEVTDPTTTLELVQKDQGRMVDLLERLVDLTEGRMA